MSEAGRGQRNDAASPDEGRSHGWRRWLTPTGAPPGWGLVRYMTCGLLVGMALSASLPDVRGALLGGLTGLVVAAAGSGGPSGVARRVALAAAGSGLVLTVVAFATGSHPVWAALAMAAVALVTSLAAAAGPLGAVLGFLGSLAYFLVATMARVADLFEHVSLGWAVAHIAVGCVGGLLVVLSRSRRCGVLSGRSTSTPGTAFAARCRSRSSCTSSSATEAATRSGSSSPRA